MDGSRMNEPVVLENDVVSTRTQRAEMPLYASRIKVYPKDIKGTFRRVKWAVLVFCLAIYYVAPWLRWDRGPGAPDQALLIDLPGGRAFFFSIEIWPQEVYYITGLLILAAIGLFLATSLFGRVWCGYACPQTVWTDLYLWVERLIEGDRNARRKLDQQPLSAAKAAKKILKHAVWLLIAAATGGAWVMYFNDAPTVLRQIVTLQAGAGVYTFFGLFTATTYLLAGWAREQVCTYMCPWPRIQAAMLDESSLIVTYQAWRGEKRGKAKQNTDWSQRGDCVDCGLCVAVCPTGIDIRDGQQLECIGCGLCIDACNTVMPKVGRPRDLILFDTLANQEAKAAKQPSVYRLLRPRVVIYAALLCAVGAVMLAALWLRADVELNVLRDRNPLFVTLSDGAIRNAYTVKVLNKTREAGQYVLEAGGVPGARLSVVSASDDGNDATHVTLTAKPDSVATYRVFVTAPRGALAADSINLTFTLRAETGRDRVRYNSVFIGPGR
jgi:cytochrome c oxidase accessory protein FixG